MDNKIKIKSYGHAFGLMLTLVGLFSFAEFLLFYIPSGFYYEYDALIVTASYLTTMLEIIIPVLSATVIFLVFGGGVKNKILPSFFVALTRLFYSVPYYYIYYVSDVFDSSEAIILALLISILFVTVSALQTFICIFITSFVYHRKNSDINDIQRASIFNFDDQMNFATLICTFFIFTVFFIREIINTVEYLLESKGTYRTNEILLIILAYVLLFVFAFIAYAVGVLVKNRMEKKANE